MRSLIAVANPNRNPEYDLCKFYFIIVNTWNNSVGYPVILHQLTCKTVSKADLIK